MTSEPESPTEAVPEINERAFFEVAKKSAGGTR